MVEFRDLQFLHALSQHRHFARAAETCGVSQPAFSTRIQKLEAQLGVPLVRRDNRFQGLTPEGEKLLPDRPNITSWQTRMQDTPGFADINRLGP